MEKKNGFLSRIGEKIKPIAFFLLVMVILTGFGVMTFAVPAREFSANENRNLAQFPETNMETILAGDFQEGLSDYLSDQVPGREFWIGTNTAIKKFQGQKEINGVYLGKDGYYFQKFTDESFDPQRTAVIFEQLEKFAAKQEVPVTLMIVPTPGAALSEKLPANAPFYDADKLWQQLQNATSSCEWIDLRQSFATADAQIYYRTDHHWTALGAYRAYQAFSDQAKPLEAFGLTQVSNNFYGTIYSKTLDTAAQPDAIYAPQNLPQVQVTVTKDGVKTVGSVYAEEFLQGKDQYAYFFGGNFDTVQIETGVKNGKRLLIFKDSFANSFAPYLLGEYEQITMVDLRYYTGNVQMLVEQSGTTEILFLYEMSNLLTDNNILNGILRLTR